MSSSEQLIWTTDEWREEARDWIASQLAAIELSIAGELEQPHIRPWSTAMRVPTKSRNVWFKAVTHGLGYEPALTRFLSELMPGHTPTVLALDVERAWLLMEDLGTPMRLRIRETRDLGYWDRSLELYARLQQAAADRLEDLTETGLPDGRPAPLRARWEELIGDTGLLGVGDEQRDPDDRITEAAYRRALRLWPRIAELLEEIESYRVPYTIVHDDLHDHNVFLKQRDREEQLIIADWGDASIGNPFCTLTVLMNSMAYHREVEQTDPDIVAVRDCYLAHWESYAAMPELRKAAELATRLGMLSRALSWRDAIASSPPQSVTEYIDAVPGWLADFVETFETTL